MSDNGNDPQTGPVDSKKEDTENAREMATNAVVGDPRLIAVREITQKLKRLLSEYVPGGEAFSRGYISEMSPASRLNRLARALADVRFQAYVVAFLKTGEDSNPQKTAAVLGLHGLPEAELAELHAWLQSFRTIYVADYRDSILEAVSLGRNPGDPSVIDPYLGGLGLFESDSYTLYRKVGMSPDIARRAAKGEIKPRRRQAGGCVLVLGILLGLGIATVIVVVTVI